MDKNNSICTLKERLKFYDCDYLNRIKISTLLKLSADIAGYDYTVKGFSHEFLWEREMVFLLSRISLKIHEYPSQKEFLTTSTWECGKKGAIFIRNTCIENEAGKTIVDMKNGWILANPITRHIHKPTVFSFDMPQYLEKTVSAKDIGKIAYDKLTQVASREVRLTDLDNNGHMYNAVYADIACDSLSKEQFEKSVDNFRINYVSEAVFGDTIDIYSQETENMTVIVGKIGEKVCFETEFIFK